MCRTNFKKTLLLLSTLVFSIMSAGCSGNGGKPDVEIVMAPYFGSWLCTYGIVSGEVVSEDVNINIDYSLAFDDQMMAGNYPIGAMNTAAFAISREVTSHNLKAMAVYLAHTGVDADNGVALVYVKKDSPLSSPADLVGKKIGVPGLNSGIASTFVGLLQSEYGISEEAVIFVAGGPPQLIEFVRKGDLDAAIVLGDPSVQAYYAEDLRVLWNLDNAFSDVYNTYNPASFLTVRSDYLEENPELVKAVYELLIKSRQYGEAHLGELAQAYVDEYGGDTEFYKNAYLKHYSVTFDSIEGSLRDSVTAIFGFVNDRGIINSIPEPDELFVEW